MLATKILISSSASFRIWATRRWYSAAQALLPTWRMPSSFCMFWASLFETIRGGDDGLVETAAKAAAVAMVAATVDYGLVPKRLTPGWEEVLPGRSVVGGFAAMAVGLALGGMRTRAGRRET